MPSVNRELSGELISPEIKIDGKIKITPRNVWHPLVQEFFADKGILRVTEDNRVGLRIYQGISLAGFNRFLFGKGIEINDPTALDTQGDVMPTDPAAMAKHYALSMIKKALLGKDWTNIPSTPEVLPEEHTVVDDKLTEALAAEEDSEPKLQTLMVIMFVDFKRTLSVVNHHVLQPLQRLMQTMYKSAIRAIIDLAFGKIDYRRDEYLRARRLAAAYTDVTKEIKPNPASAKQEKPKEQMVWRTAAEPKVEVAEPQIKSRFRFTNDDNKQKLVPQPS